MAQFEALRSFLAFLAAVRSQREILRLALPLGYRKSAEGPIGDRASIEMPE
jgi:hypothetical protein